MQINNPSSGGVWGSITGVLTNQTDLNTSLTAKVVKTATANRVYGTDGAGAAAFYNASATTPAASSVVLRSANSRIACADPAAATDVATKGYSDAQFSPNTRTAVNALTGASTAADIVTALKTL